jgi:hypothetical protein
MEFCGVVGDAEAVGDLFAAESFGHHFKRLEFTRGQEFVALLVLSTIQDRRQTACDLDWYREQACRGGVNCGDDLLRRSVPRQDCANAGT